MKEIRIQKDVSCARCSERTFSVETIVEAREIRQSALQCGCEPRAAAISTAMWEVLSRFVGTLSSGQTELMQGSELKAGQVEDHGTDVVCRPCFEAATAEDWEPYDLDLSRQQTEHVQRVDVLLSCGNCGAKTKFRDNSTSLLSGDYV